MQVNALGPCAGQRAGGARGGLRAGRGQSIAALAGRCGAGADALCRTATRSWRPCSRPWRRPGRAWPGGGPGRRGRGGQVAPGVRVRPLPPHAGLAGAGERLGVLWQGHAVLPGHRPAQALLPCGRRTTTRTIRAKVTGQVLTLDEASRTRSPPCWRSWTPCRTTARSCNSIHPAPPAHARRAQARAAARKPGAAAAPGLRGSALDRYRDPGPARQPGREPAHRPAPAAGQLSARVPARLGQQDLLHPTAAGPTAAGERRRVLARPAGGRPQPGSRSNSC